MKQKERLKERPCAHCGVTFRPTRRWQKFCQGTCRWAAWDEAHPRQGVATS